MFQRRYYKIQTYLNVLTCKAISAMFLTVHLISTIARETDESTNQLEGCAYCSQLLLLLKHEEEKWNKKNERMYLVTAANGLAITTNSG